MRDLANLSYLLSKISGIPRAFRLIILAVVVGGVLFFLGSKLNLPVGGGQDLVLRDPPRNLTPVTVEGGSVSDGGMALTKKTTTLKDVKYGGEAFGTASRSFGGGTYILSVNATLPDPKNTTYQVWLSDGDSMIPIDYMSGSKTSWSLRLRSTDKYSSYRSILVTLERTKDNLPEERVLEGSF